LEVGEAAAVKAACGAASWLHRWLHSYAGLAEMPAGRWIAFAKRKVSFFIFLAIFSGAFDWNDSPVFRKQDWTLILYLSGYRFWSVYAYYAEFCSTSLLSRVL
jgi:hypothetical protein